MASSTDNRNSQKPQATATIGRSNNNLPCWQRSGTSPCLAEILTDTTPFRPAHCEIQNKPAPGVRGFALV